MHDILMQRTFLIDGESLKVEVEEMTEPTVKRKTAKISGGAHGVAERTVGVEELAGAKITVNGISTRMLSAFGIKLGKQIDVQILDSFETNTGESYKVEHNWSGQLLTMQEKGAKSTGDDKAKSSREFEFMALNEASKKVDGVVEYDINIATDLMNFGAGDEMEVHRRNTGQS